MADLPPMLAAPLAAALLVVMQRAFAGPAARAPGTPAAVAWLVAACSS